MPDFDFRVELGQVLSPVVLLVLLWAGRAARNVLLRSVADFRKDICEHLEKADARAELYEKRLTAIEEAERQEPALLTALTERIAHIEGAVFHAPIVTTVEKEKEP